MSGNLEDVEDLAVLALLLDEEDKIRKNDEKGFGYICGKKKY